MFPFIDTAPRAARPMVVFAIIAVNTVAFLWLRSLPKTELDDVLVQYALIPVRYTAPEAAGLDPYNWWPLLSNMFLHGGWMHLIFNMWFLWIFGPAMEARFGQIGFVSLYLIGGLVANIVHIATHPHSPDPVLGASGAIAAVIAAYAVTYPAARVMTIVPIGIIPLFFRIPAVVFAVIWFILQLLQGTFELASPGVAWWAHIGGFAFGAFFALVVGGFAPGLQTKTTTWTDMRGRRVPDIKPRYGPRYGSDRYGSEDRGPWG
ncbi:MAG: rhomboid family intramembrane serine protease [Bradyrhizobiaceae bacterium]|nr:rhomboid family intramembrane serine protease [Bradyrhizobiaceae bacterium]